VRDIFDTHAHYTDARFAPGRAALLEGLPGRGVSLVLTCGSSVADSRAALALAQQFPFVYAACGVHPHEAASLDSQAIAALRVLLQSERCAAVGEIGLDYHYDFAPREVQRSAFRQQLALAQEYDLPMVLHSREAHEDTLRMLQAVALRGVVHCFSGSWETAQALLGMGYYLGFGGAVTFKNARRPLEVAAQAPLDRLLLETDAPYMAPVPFRGQRCESPHIACTAAAIAAARGMDAQALVDVCRANGRRLFGV
jgi:TatD DNase family protein